LPIATVHVLARGVVAEEVELGATEDVVTEEGELMVTEVVVGEDELMVKEVLFEEKGGCEKTILEETTSMVQLASKVKKRIGVNFFML
jgi:hypothetical protein